MLILIMELVANVAEMLDMGDRVFFTLLAFTILIMLYAISLIHRKFHLLENDLQAIRKEQSVISEELELIVSMARDRKTDAKGV